MSCWQLSGAIRRKFRRHTGRAFLSLLLGAWLCHGSVQAQDTAPGAEDWEMLRTQARELRSKTKQMRTESKAAVQVANKICWEKVLVSSCMEEAKNANQKVESEARQIDLEALAIERRIAAHDLAVKQAKKQDKQQKREEKAAQKAAALREEDAARERKEAERHAKEERRQQQKD